MKQESMGTLVVFTHRVVWQIVMALPGTASVKNQAYLPVSFGICGNSPKAGNKRSVPARAAGQHSYDRYQEAPLLHNTRDPYTTLHYTTVVQIVIYRHCFREQ